MESVAHLVKVTLPNYLSGLPVPSSLKEILNLKVKDWLALIPPTALLAGLGYMSYQTFCPNANKGIKTTINGKIKKNTKKVVDTIDIEEISEKKVFCRCWKSDNWPYCDGAHGRHNEATGDNIGPLIITKNK